MKLLKLGNQKEVNMGELEDELERIYQPRTPRPEFVRKLRYQLVQELEPTQTRMRNERRRLVWAIGASLVGSVLALFVGVRTILTLGAALGLLLEMRRESPISKPLPIRQAK